MSSDLYYVERKGELYGFESKEGMVWAKTGTLVHIDSLAQKGGRTLSGIFQLVKDHQVTGYQVDGETYYDMNDAYKLCYDPKRIAYLYAKTEEELEKQKKALESHNLPKYKIISDVGVKFDGLRPGIKKLIERFFHYRYETLYLLNRKSMGEEGFHYLEYLLKNREPDTIIILGNAPK
jgi:hypothetical protein